MSSRSYPITAPCSFLVDKEVLAYAMLAEDKRNGCVPVEIQNLLDSGEFPKAAREGIDVDGYRPEDLMDSDIIDAAPFVSTSYFEGEIVTCDFALEAAVRRNPEAKSIDQSFFEGTIVYMEPQKWPSFFKAAYSSPNELLREYVCTLNSSGIYLPASFAWWEHIVDINGTCYG